MEDKTKNWLDSARYDLNTAESLFGSERYVYALFFCHLALEKVLKAVVEKRTGSTPPKTHDLEYLLELADLSPDKETEEFVAEISNVSVFTRYPEDFGQLIRDYSKQRTEPIMRQTKELFLWIETFTVS